MKSYKKLLALTVIAILIPTIAVAAESQGRDNRVGIELMANNHSFADLKGIDFGSVSTDQLRSDTSQSLIAFADLELGRFLLGGRIVSISPTFGDLSSLTEFLYGSAYVGMNVVDTTNFDIYLKAVARESTDNVIGLEDVEGGSVGIGAGIVLEF